jgi:hypothetical protein
VNPERDTARYLSNVRGALVDGRVPLAEVAAKTSIYEHVLREFIIGQRGLTRVALDRVAKAVGIETEERGMAKANGVHVKNALTQKIPGLERFANLQQQPYAATATPQASPPAGSGSSSIELVTPAMAADWIAKYRNELNRKHSQARVDLYARDMTNGRWYLNHQGVAFDINGTLIDGEHRLRAVIKANIPVRMFVARGCSSHGIDRNRPRSAVDERRMRGQKCSRLYIASVKEIEKLARGTWSIQLSDDDVSIIEAAHPSAVAWLVDNTAHQKFTAPVFGAMAYVYEIDPQAVESFYSQIRLIEAPGSHACAFLRQFQNKPRAGAAQMKSGAILTLHALRMFVTNTEQSFLRPTEESVNWWRSRAER